MHQCRTVHSLLAFDLGNALVATATETAFHQAGEYEAAALAVPGFPVILNPRITPMLFDRGGAISTSLVGLLEWWWVGQPTATDAYHTLTGIELGPPATAESIQNTNYRGAYRCQRRVLHPFGSPPQEDDLKYAIVACAEGFGLTQISQIPFHDDTARPVRLDPIVLRPADQVVSGVVEDSNDQPVAGALVKVYGPRLSRSFSQPPCGKALTDAQGRFRIAGVCKEPLRIEAVSPSPQRQRGVTWAHGGNENVRVVLGQKLIFSASLIGKSLPELGDLKIDLSPADVSDKVILVCFWDMNQRPSRHCIRQLTTQANQLKQKGVIVVVVQASNVDENTLNQWVKDYNIPFSVGMVPGDEEKTRFTWSVRSLPWLILTDGNHIVTAEGFVVNELDEKIAEAALRKKQ